MHKLIFFAVVVLLLFTSMCWRTPCFTDSDCDDDNECTTEFCVTSYYYDPDPGWGDSSSYCKFTELEDGIRCDFEGRPGECWRGTCRPTGETDELLHDGGI